MTSPGFNEPFHTAYDAFSRKVADVSIPSYFDVFAPDTDNDVDFKCRSVISANPKLGAARWTVNGRWLTIGIYRDEGRTTAQRPAHGALSWTRTGNVLTMTDLVPHDLIAGAKVDLYTVNVAQLPGAEVIEIVSAYIFKVRCLATGTSSGSSGGYQPSYSTDFAEERVVYRLLPSFQVLTLAAVDALLASAAPSQQTQRRDLFDITTQAATKLPNARNGDYNFFAPTRYTTRADLLNLKTRFDQAYDEQGAPLKLNYLHNGALEIKYLNDTKYSNGRIFYNTPVVLEGDGNDTVDAYPHVYDFYGFELNDVTRGPSYSTTIISRDTEVAGVIGNIKRQQQNSAPIFSGVVFDRFGNIAIGIQANNAMVSREGLLPLQLDQFNRPVKSPLPSTGRS